MDYYKFLDEFDTYNEWNRIQSKNDEWMDDAKYHPKKSDRVNSPSHYTSGKTEVIDIIEDAVKDAPANIYGMLQSQVLKYMLRVWLKDNPLEDMKKARWYLDRLIAHYSNPPGEDSFPPKRWDSSLDDFR
ncbi:MAG: DUF3310 domain-containing protein [Alphaproteobacteria bacterium]|nr:DUF3310 domain-containing protein [Alphaproteobacteria bacterium]